MTAPTKATGRRTLAIKANRWAATRYAEEVFGELGRDAEIRVELGGPGSTDAMPYAVTARKLAKTGGAS